MSLRLSTALLTACFCLGFDELFATPSITSFNPWYGASNDANYVTITGSGFYPGTLVVKFNGATDATASAISSTIINARVPANAPLGAQPLFVSVNGSGTFSSSNFTVIGPGPYADHFTPTTGGDGA